MKHLFVLPKLAFKLKKKGFNEPCFGCYENDSKVLVINYTTLPPVHPQAKKRPSMFEVNNLNSELPQWATSAPTYQQAVDWLRETHKIHIELYQQISIKNYHPKLVGEEQSNFYPKIEGYFPYYKALAKAIEEALKLVKKLTVE